jgi:hypothetical protein
MKTLASIIFSVLILAFSVSAQTNEFTYQGKLTDSGMSSPTYDFEFRLCTAESAGNCSIPTPAGVLLEFKQRLGVPVLNGIFTVKLDFDATHFTGAERSLEILVRRDLGGSWTTLSPRQKITSSPYSIKSVTSTAADSLSAACVLCITDPHIQSIAGSKVTGTVAIANGGTGSSTQSFVDLSSNQPNIFGAKTFRNNTNFSGVATFSNSAVFNGADPVQMNALNLGNGLTADVVSVSELSATGGIQAGQFSGSGSGLTNLNGTNVTTGTIADARLSTNVATLNGPQIFAGLKHFAGGLTFSGSLGGDGAGLTNLNASNITSGVFTGNGSGLTNLNGSNIASGTIPENRLGVAGMGFAGRIDGLTPSDLQVFGGANGFTNAVLSPGTIYILSPNRSCTATSLSVMLTNVGFPVPPGADNSRKVELLVNNFNTAVECTMSGSATSCNSGTATTLITAGSRLSFQIVSTDGGTTGNVGGTSILFGWECR